MLGNWNLCGLWISKCPTDVHLYLPFRIYLSGIYIYVYMCMYVYTCAHMCIYVCINVDLVFEAQQGVRFWGHASGRRLLHPLVRLPLPNSTLVHQGNAPY